MFEHSKGSSSLVPTHSLMNIAKRKKDALLDPSESSSYSAPIMDEL